MAASIQAGTDTRLTFTEGQAMPEQKRNDTGSHQQSGKIEGDMPFDNSPSTISGQPLGLRKTAADRPYDQSRLPSACRAS